MKTTRISLVVALGVVLLGCQPQPQHSAPAPLAQANPHEHIGDARQPPPPAAAAEHAHDEMHSTLRLDQGQPWATDAPLVEGMNKIRVAVKEASALPTLDADSADALAQTVRTQVNFLIANCRLEPEADATLHVFIGQLLNAAAALGEDPASPSGLPQLQQTLREYPRYFDHPGWQPEAITAQPTQ